MKTGHDIIVIGASAGGVSALSEVVRALPADLPAAVLIVLHISRSGTSAMPSILSRVGLLPATHPQDGEPLRKGHIYVAPPDHHLVIENSHVALSRAPSENGHRPAIDVLFRTAANAYGKRVVGVVLTGNLDDGTAGLAEIKARGGVAIVQDPAEADYPGMPASAAANVTVDYIKTLTAIPPLLVELAEDSVEEAGPNPGQKGENMKEALEQGRDREPGVPSGFTCPECGGALWESHLLDVVHFRCRTGHAFSPESLLAEQGDVLEGSLWAAVRALEENASLARRMERWMRERGNKPGENRYLRRALEAEAHAETIRKLLVHEEASEPVAQ